MEATEILSSEHRVIEEVVAALDVAAERLEEGKPVRPGFFLDAVRLLRDFADGYHHGKEESVLFEALARHGFPTEAGPVGVMLYEHDTARVLTNGLREAAERLQAGEPGAPAVVVDYARAYGELLAQHIAKEDGILFPMAAAALPATEREALLPAFDRVERDQQEKGDKASFLALARLLSAEMGVDAERVASRRVELPCHARC